VTVFNIELEKESDGRWLAEVTELPGVMCYGADKAEAVAKVQALALRATGVDVRLGRFKAKSLTCPLCGRSFVRFEEKETDVALGVQLLERALRDSCDAVVLVSGDSDLVPALVAARRLAASTTLVIGLPFGRTNAALERAADMAFTIKPSAYAKHQLAVEGR